MKRSYAYTAAAFAALAALAGCGGTPSATATAASVLAQAGATAAGAAYTVPPGVTYAACNAGSAEADGSTADSTEVNVCVFPNSADLAQSAAISEQAGPQGGATIQAGPLTLIYLPGELDSTPAQARQIAARVHGTVLVP